MRNSIDGAWRRIKAAPKKREANQTRRSYVENFERRRWSEESDDASERGDGR